MIGNLSDPVLLFVVSIGVVSVLLVLLCLSIYYYCKAKDLAPYLLKREELLNDIVTSQKTLSEVREEIRKLLDEQALAERCIADGKAAKDWLAANDGKITALKIEVEESQTRLKIASDEREKRERELGELVQKVANKQVEVEQCQKSKIEFDFLLKRLAEEKKIVEAEVARLQSLREKVDEEFAKFAERKNQLEREVRDLEERKRQRESVVGDLKTAQAELKAVQARVAEFEGRANEATKVLASVRQREDFNKDRWRDLDRAFCVMQARNEDAIGEDVWLKTFERCLGENGIHFNQRIIKAFHTGLKCADRSPLVVLAGISGTGKSLLPELYAAALGMTYLPVAVQPRWDSPQDLFGFYNYMEGRYKATELSRLLWQYDVFNNEIARAKYKADSLPMNLVLLDEMNLARVEYYFSDLLSKLEVRRGLNCDIPDERRKAEIEIECNASDKNEQTRRLFVGLNTLFVGTMNEDETTQTLSDKVLDRSNVLRFGRPSKLGAQPDKANFMIACMALPAVTQKVWRSWQKDNPERRGKAMERVKSINEALERVGRPFAHRVWQSIEGYVSFYPGNSLADFNAAFADQIEMKILPKLNGLELDAVGFDKVKVTVAGVIAELDDARLVDAFDLACNPGHASFFKWRGVMR